MLSLRALAINAIVGLVILFIANVIGLGVQISLVTLLLCAIFGVPGVILLAAFDIAFMAAVLPAVPALLV